MNFSGLGLLVAVSLLLAVPAAAMPPSTLPPDTDGPVAVAEPVAEPVPPAVAQPLMPEWTPATATNPAPPLPGRPYPPQSPWIHVDLRVDLQNLFYFKNDSDFDRSAPLYNQTGQTVGAFATFLKPRATFHILGNLRIVCEIEVGLNYWTKNNPDEQNPLAADIFVMKFREIYGEGETSDGHMGFRAGYTRFRDPTGLFLDAWIGAAQVWMSTGPGRRLGVFLGQIPNQVYDGIIVDQNNFVRNIWVFGARSDNIMSRAWRLNAALTGLVDTHIVNQTRWILAPSLHIEGVSGRWAGLVDFAGQMGQDMTQVSGAHNQLWLAWAAQGQLRLQLRHAELRWTALLLSPDDAHDGNGRNYAFLYSGKSRSATLMLTEDEIRDWYNNMDERASRFQGGFFLNRAGLFVGDMMATFPWGRYFRPSLIAGVSTVLKPENALGGILFGIETDVVLEFLISDWLILHVVGGGLFPGAAGAALINTINNRATDPMGMVEASILIRY